jgi:hypothetical protein
MRWKPKPYYREKWHLWFAWRPVQINDGTWVWLERVYRKYTMYYDGYDPEYILID